MRLILILLALLSGLSAPQAVAASAAARADSSVVASESVALTPMRRDCVVRCAAERPGTSQSKRKTVWLPVFALVAPSAIHIGDRARE